MEVETNTNQIAYTWKRGRHRGNNVINIFDGVIPLYQKWCNY